MEVKFKPLEGREDQAGGLVWRWKDGDNYYVARANALGKQRVALLHRERSVESPSSTSMHLLRATSGTRCAWNFLAKSIKVLLDGKQYIKLEDNHISGAGAVGVWTKADSVTAFDDFSFGGK